MRAGQAWPHRSVASLDALLPAWPAPIVSAGTEDGDARDRDRHPQGHSRCCLVDALGAALEERTFANDPAGHRALLDWAIELGPRRVGIEGSSSFGAPAARFLVAADRDVREVPPQLTHRERTRTRRAARATPAMPSPSLA